MNAENTFIKVTVVIDDGSDGGLCTDKYINAKGIARFEQYGGDLQLTMFSKETFQIRSGPDEFIRLLENCNGIQVVSGKTDG